MLVFVVALSFLSCKNQKMNPETNTGLIIEQKIDSLLTQMTLDEKIGQMTQVRHLMTSLAGIGWQSKKPMITFLIVLAIPLTTLPL